MTTSSVKQESPLNQIDLDSLRQANNLSVEERPFQGYIILRGKADDKRFIKATTKVLKQALPLTPNTAQLTSELDVLWYGPSEWLLITPPDKAADLVDKLSAALQGIHALVTETTGGNTMLEISGSAARNLLAKGSPYDFHPTVFALGQCTQTVLAKTAATIFPVGDGASYRVIVRRSFADYLGVWLRDAAREFIPH